MRKNVVLVWLLGALTFGAGIVAGANWYEPRSFGNTISADEWQRLIRDGCEPVNSPTTVLYYRCPRFHLH